MIEIQRVYDPEPANGSVFLVDRLWPRGKSKSDLRLDGWVREAAPSDELRMWFGHRPERFSEFARRYRKELDAHPDAVKPLLEAAAGGDQVTLLYAAKDPDHNQAVVLRDYLQEKLP